MPDENTSSNSTNNAAMAIQTQTELEVAQTQAAQLQSDLSQITELDATYHECEALLSVIRTNIATFQNGSITNPPAPDSLAPAQPSEPPNPGDSPPIVLPAPQSGQGSGASSPQQPTDAIAPASAVSAPSDDVPAVSPIVVKPPTPSSSQNNPFDSAGSSDSTGQPSFTNASALPDTSTEMLQVSAQEVQRAFELNTQSQLSLYSRMLELLDDQNRKLDELDRRASELSNQIKSLKNP